MPESPAADLLPLFPLGSVLVPGQVLPLHVFEPRYRLLVQTLLERPEPERAFGVVAIREGFEVGAGAARALYDVGTTARVRQVRPLDDGRFDLLAVGGQRFRVLGLDDRLPYLRARVEPLPEPCGATGPRRAATVRQRFAAYRRAVAATGAAAEEDPADLPTDATALSYQVACGMVLDLAERQALLAAADTDARLLAERALLARETGLLQVLPSLPAGDLARAAVAPN